jgi:hypothetical protein
VGAVLSFEQERERIFLRWLLEVERLLGGQVNRDAAFQAWAEGYSAAEYSREVEWCGERERVLPRCSACMDTFWVCENHDDRPWDGPAACGCGGAGMPCPACNQPEPGERPRLPAGFEPDVDVDDE